MMKRGRIVKAGLFVAIVAGALSGVGDVASQQRQRQLVAVVELDAEKGTAGPGEVFVLTDSVRSAATEVINTDCYTIMTRESMEVLMPQGTRMECLAGKCVVDIGKTLQARFIVGGSIRRLGKSLVLTIELFEVKSGALLGSKQVQGMDVEQLMKGLKDAAPKVMGLLLNLPGLQGGHRTDEAEARRELVEKADEKGLMDALKTGLAPLLPVE